MQTHGVFLPALEFDQGTECETSSKMQIEYHIQRALQQGLKLDDEHFLLKRIVRLGVHHIRCFFFHPSEMVQPYACLSSLITPHHDLRVKNNSNLNVPGEAWQSPRLAWWTQRHTPATERTSPASPEHKLSGDHKRQNTQPKEYTPIIWPNLRSTQTHSLPWRCTTCINRGWESSSVSVWGGTHQ